MKRALSSIAPFLFLLLFIGVCLLWLRTRNGSDEAYWRYDRWLSDGSAAGDSIYLSSDRRLWLTLSRGRVGPYNGQLVWGYHVNADQSGGRPRIGVEHYPLDWMMKMIRAQPDRTPGLGPVRWDLHRRTAATHGDDHRSLRLGISHWLAALLLAVPPALWLHRYLQRRRTARAGLCPSCGYDLRATPDRCPECGTIPSSQYQRHKRSAPCS